MIEGEELRRRIVSNADITRNLSDDDLREIITQMVIDEFRDCHLSLKEKMQMSKDLFNKIRGPRMFTQEHLSQIDKQYFNVITLDDRDVTIQSRNTGHYWYLHCTEYPQEESLVLFHKHRFRHPYHQHGRANTLRQAVRSIKNHDVWQLEGRKTH